MAGMAGRAAIIIAGAAVTTGAAAKEAGKEAGKAAAAIGGAMATCPGKPVI